MALINYIRGHFSRLLTVKYTSPAQLFIREKSEFVPKRVLVLTKISRYEIEKIREPSLDESLLKKRLLERGSNYDAIVAAHHKNKLTEQKTIEVLKKHNIEFKLIDRFSINNPSIDWADLVLPIGGDGTFLLASNLINDNTKPILGINSDPTSSEGRLLLPAKYTNDINAIFERLRCGSYNVLMRSRIRVVLRGENIWSRAFHLHDKGIVTGEQRFYKENEGKNFDESMVCERRLPWLALNEVFIGESHSARTSSLLINTDEDGDLYHKVKSSGLCVSTGTGSTSWYEAINCVSAQTVREIFQTAKCDSFFTDEQIDMISTSYNNNLQFPADDLRLSYAIRDMIIHKHLSLPKYMHSRGFCKKLCVRSLCFDAGLVFDGGISVPFNAGTSASMEIHPNDALCNIILD